MSMVAGRIAAIGLSPALAISARARDMRRRGLDVVDFSIGEPDFPSPASVKEAGKRAIDDDFSHYTPPFGLPELREAVAGKLRRENRLAVTPDEVILSPGAKFALFTACVSLLEPGDEVLIPRPYWFSYPALVHLAGGVARFVETREEDRYLLAPGAFEKALGPRTRMLILNNPSNPTGMTYPRPRLEELAAIAARRGVWVLADEIYEKLVYDGEFVSFASLSEAAARRTVTVNGFSKAFAMTGWRLGYAAGPREVIDAMGRVQSQTTASLCSISQRAGLAALTAPPSVVNEMVATFRARRDLMAGRLQSLPGVTCPVPDGAFYAFPNVARCVARLPDPPAPGEASVRLAEHLLETAHVAVLPGAAFGADANLRLSYATSMAEIERGLEAMERALR